MHHHVLLRFWASFLRKVGEKGHLLRVLRLSKRLCLLFLAAIRRLFGFNLSSTFASETKTIPHTTTTFRASDASARGEIEALSCDSLVPVLQSSVLETQEPLDFRTTRLEEGLLDDAPENPSLAANHLELQAMSQPVDDPDNRLSRHASSSSSSSSSKTSVLLKAQTLIPIRPMQSDRHNRDCPLNHKSTLVELKPCTTSFKKENILEAWICRIHPLGQPYYHKMHQRRMYITEADITDTDRLAVVHGLIDQVEELISSHENALPDHIQVYLEPWHNGGKDCGYYMVDTNPDNRCIFWLHSLDVAALKLGALHSPSDLYNYMLKEYWKYCEQLPHCADINDAVVDELHSVLMHALVDLMRYTDSTAPFSREDLEQLLDRTEQMKQLMSLEDNKPYIVAVIGSLMFRIADRRRINWHGRHGAVLYRSVYTSNKRTLLIKIFSPPLFSAPDRYLRLLRHVNPNDFVVKRNWPQFIALLEKPWNDCILYSTVLLAVNISYLAVPAVDSTSGTESAGQIASLCSTILSIGCIVVGLLLVSEDHTEPKASGGVSRAYFEQLESHKFGYEPLAILYSLPYALLMWSMLTFVVAIALFCYQIDDVQRGVTALPAAIVLGLVSWEIRVHWKSSSPHSHSKRLLRKLPKSWQDSFLFRWMGNGRKRSASTSSSSSSSSCDTCTCSTCS